MRIICKEIETMPELIDAIRLRVEVFIKEQGFAPGWEPDEDDKVSRQFVAVAQNKIVATARFRYSSDHEIKIERMAVDKNQRGIGVGSTLVAFVIAKALGEHPKKVWMQSQLSAKSFYEKCGFIAISDPYDAWGVLHIDMEYHAAA